MLKIIQNIIAYTVEKRFFISIVKDETKQEIIADSDIQENSEISIHRPIKIRKSLKVIDKLTLGRKQLEVSNNDGNLLFSSISMDTAANGELLGFSNNRCTTIRPKHSIFLTPINPINIIHNDINYTVEEFPENHTTIKNWQFVLPSNIHSNIVSIQFYFLNTGPLLDSCFFKYGLNTISKGFSYNDINYTDYKFRINSDIIISENKMTNIVDINEDYTFNNKLCNLSLIRNKDIGSSDTCRLPIYLIGVKIEYNLNYFVTNM